MEFQPRRPSLIVFNYCKQCAQNTASLPKSHIYIFFRFSDTVTAIFNGHTHSDHFNIYYYNDTATYPVAVAINGASVTPIGGKRSNYKVYTVDPVTFVSM